MLPDLLVGVFAVGVRLTVWVLAAADGNAANKGSGCRNNVQGFFLGATFLGAADDGM